MALLHLREIICNFHGFNFVYISIISPIIMPTKIRALKPPQLVTLSTSRDLIIKKLYTDKSYCRIIKVKSFLLIEYVLNGKFRSIMPWNLQNCHNIDPKSTNNPQYLETNQLSPHICWFSIHYKAKMQPYSTWHQWKKAFLGLVTLTLYVSMYLFAIEWMSHLCH